MSKTNIPRRAVLAGASLLALPSIARAVDDQVEVWMDGGIRSGQDVLKALAMGAKAIC